MATGEKHYADSVRTYGDCGRNAKLFEPKYLHGVGPPPDYAAQQSMLQQALGMQNLAQYQAQAMQNAAVGARYGQANGLLGSLVGYGQPQAAISAWDTTVSPSCWTQVQTVSAPAEWAKPEPDIHPFLQDKPRPRWKFDAPDGWTLLAILLSGALLVTGAWMVLS